MINNETFKKADLNWVGLFVLGGCIMSELSLNLVV